MRSTFVAPLACLGLLAVHRSAPAQQPPPSVPTYTVTAIDSVLALGGDYFRAKRRASRDSLLAQLSAARARWHLQGSPRLSFRVKMACFCTGVPPAPEYATVEAAGDSVLSVVDQRGRPARSLHPTNGRPSIRWLFAYAEEAIRGDADMIIVTFDPVLGIPTRIMVDPMAYASDDQLDITVSHIVIAPARR
jgi:hypothetical protein